MLGARVVGGVCHVSAAEASSPARGSRSRGLRRRAGRGAAAPKNVVAVVAPREAGTRRPSSSCPGLGAGRAARPLCEVRPSSVWCDRQGAELRRLAIALPESAPTAHYTHDWNSQPVRARRPPSAFSLQPARRPRTTRPPRRRRPRASRSTRSCPSGTGSSAACRSTSAGSACARRRRKTFSSTRRRLRDPKRRDDAEAAVFQLGKLAPKALRRLPSTRPRCGRSASRSRPSA